MVDKLAERKQREFGAVDKKTKPYYASRPTSPEDAITLFGELRNMGSKVKVVKKS